MSSEQTRIALVGDGPTALSALEALHRNFRLVALFRNEDDPDDPVLRRAEELGVAVSPAPDPRALGAAVDRVDPDLVVVSSYARILPPSIIDVRPFINVHYAPLPAYRGRANVNWALINGEPDVGITIHSIVPGLDAGPILAQERTPIGARDTITDLYARLNDLQERLLPDAVRARLGGELGAPQPEDGASYCCGRTPDDGLLDWTSSTESLDRLIRALTAPYPGAFTFCGTTRIVIDGAHPVPDAPVYVGRVPGRVVGVDRASGDVDVLTGDGVLRITAIRVEGEDRRPAEIVASVRDTLGLFPLAFLRAAGLTT